MDNKEKMESTQTEIIRYARLLIRKRHLFIIISLCIMSVIICGSYFIPKKYEAKSILFIESNVIQQLVKGIAITPSMDSRIKVLRDTMLARSLVLNVLRKLDLDSRTKNDKELEEMIVDFQKKTDVRVKNDNLITISLKNKDPMIARDYINTLVSEYVEKNVFAKREEAYGATRFLDKQVEFFKEKMDRGEEKVIKFRQEQGIYVAMDERSIITEIKKHSEDIENLKIRESELTAAKKSIEEQMKKEKPFTVTMFNSKDINGTITSLENRLKQLLVSYTENYPEVIKIKAEIESLKKQQTGQSPGDSGITTDSEISAINPVYQEMKQKLMDIDTEINSLNAKEKYLETLVKKKEKDLKDIPESKKKLRDLEKERDSFKEVYEQLLVRLGQSEVSKQMEIEDKATTFRIIEPAILPTIPASPNRILLIAAGIVLGLLGGGGVIFMLDNIDQSVKTVENLKTLGLPVLAVIPHISNPEELESTRKKDVLLYSIAGIYILCILVVLAMELFGVTYVDDVINGIFRIKSM